MATLRQLEAFVAVTEYKKMSDAAKKLYISQPTVSQIISDLEHEYNVTLFERHPKYLKITPAGRLLLSYAQEIIALNNNLSQSMKNINALRPLRVGVTLTIGNTLISPIADNLKESHPDIDLSVHVDNTKIIENRMIHNELDIALVEGIILREEILTKPLIDDRLELIASPKHPLAQKEKLTIEDLRNQPFIMREQGSGTRAIFENIMLSHHIPYQTKWECSSSTAIINAVHRNFGLGVLSFRCVSESVKQGTLKILTLPEISMKRSFTLCYNKNHPVTTQMHDFIEEAQKFQTI